MVLEGRHDWQPSHTCGAGVPGRMLDVVERVERGFPDACRTHVGRMSDVCHRKLSIACVTRNPVHSMGSSTKISERQSSKEREEGTHKSLQREKTKGFSEKEGKRACV